MNKLELLRGLIATKRDLVVAFSGGVDSGLLLSVAHDVLGDNLLAVMIVTELVPGRELTHAKEVLSCSGVRYRLVRVSMLDDEDFVMNTRRRCYHCKIRFCAVLKQIATEEGITTVAEGVTASDYGEYRPGIAAAREFGIWHPLAEAGITKPEVRLMAKELGLPFWNKPSNACLATRIAYGERITMEKLRMIESAEDVISELGFSQLRVRMHCDGIARIELASEELAGLFNLKLLDCSRISTQLKKLGFRYITLDLDGYRTGSMDMAERRRKDMG